MESVWKRIHDGLQVEGLTSFNGNMTKACLRIPTYFDHIPVFSNNLITKPNSMRLFICIGILLIGKTIFAQQPYESILGEDTVTWTVPFCNLDQGYFRTQIAVDDATIGGILYKRVGRLYSGSIGYDINGSISNINGFVREDTFQGKAWYHAAIETLSGWDTLEFLIMDLGLGIGDTFTIHQPVGQTIQVLVDDIYLINGKRHVRLDYIPPGGDDKLTFIEGTGTNYGWAYMHDPYNLCPCLNNQTKDGDTIFSNANCSPITGIKNPDEQAGFIAFPNPARNKIHIQFDNPIQKNTQIEIVNTHGQVVERINLTESTTITINNRLSGLHLIRWIQGDKVIKTQKLMLLGDE